MGYYKDTAFGDEVEEVRLRPNALVATSVMFDVLNRENVKKYIEKVETELIMPNSLGIKTLSPQDNAYRANYVNNNNSEDWLEQKGFNYHNGPEWV